MKASEGKVPLQIAEACIASLPPVNPTSLIHDNGCGDGNVTRTILSSRNPAHIHATDIASELVQILTKEAKEKSWPVTTALAPAQDLPFQDNMFTHSFMHCVILPLSDEDALKACKELHRTLRPRGFAAVSGWAEVPHRRALAAAHAATRPAGSRELVGGAARWVDGTLLRKSMEGGGFKGVRMEKAKSVWEVDDLDEWVVYMWSVLGRMETGWIESDEEKWDEAVKVFGEEIRRQEGVEDLGGGKARMMGWCWIAVAEK